MSSILPKNERNSLSWASSLIRVSSEFHPFFGRIEENIICFRDCRTFIVYCFIQNVTPNCRQNWTFRNGPSSLPWLRYWGVPYNPKNMVRTSPHTFRRPWIIIICINQLKKNRRLAFNFPLHERRTEQYNMCNNCNVKLNSIQINL